MIDLPDYEAVIDYLSRPMDTRLHALVAGRLKDSITLGLQDLTHIVVVEPGDSEEQLVQALGFSPLYSRLDGPEHQPDPDWVERHAGWIEAVYTVGNEGFAFILLIPIACGVLPGLFALHREGQP